MLRGPGLGGMRGVAGLVALAAGLLLALAVMPGCGSGCPTPEQAAYLNEVENWADRSESTAGAFRELVEEVRSDSTAILDEGWRRRLRHVLDKSSSNHETMVNVEAPTGTQEVHGAVARVARTDIEANELYWQGVLNLDADVLTKSNERRWEAMHLLEEAGAIVKRVCE